jgi:hypothetical protein
VDLEIDPIHRHEVTESLHEATGDDHLVVSCLHSATFFLFDRACQASSPPAPMH